jgi:tetratricopeptide (TPR) repeat protein
MLGVAALWISQNPKPQATAANGDAAHGAVPAALGRTSPAEAAPKGLGAKQPLAADIAINPQQLPTAPDTLFAVRSPHSALPCDAALGAPFVVKSKPSPGRGSALWSRSRRSTLANKEQLALTQMCQSASWDLAGRGAYGLVEYYFQASDFQQALQWAERIPKGSSRYLDARGMIGDIHNQRGDLEAALNAYADTFNVQLQDMAHRAQVAAGFLGGAIYALDHGDAWTAERFARRAIVLNPTSSRAALTLASAFGRFDLHEASVGWAERARELER